MQFKAQIEQEFDSLAGETDRQSFRSLKTTAADVLFLFVIFAASIMRLSGLAAIPLSPAEATEALAAFQFSQPGVHSISAGSPAYLTLTSLLIPVLGASDRVARLIPAVFGIALVALPWFFRRRIGANGVLLCAAFLAASPLNSAISRTAGGDAIALFALLLSAASLLHLHFEKDDRWYYVMAAGLGLGLTSSPLFYGGLVALVLTWLIMAVVGKEALWQANAGINTIRNASVLGLLVLLGLSTRFLTYPAGLGASAHLLGEWIAQFGLGGGLQNALAPFLVLARYEIALLLAGTTAVLWAIWKNKQLGFFLSFWLMAIFVLMLLQNGVLSNALLATLPGYLLVGLFSAHLFRQRFERWTWVLLGGLLLIGAILLVNLTRYLRVSMYEQDLSNLWLGLLMLAATALMIYYFWTMTDAAIIPAIWLAVLVILLVFEWGTAWRLSHNSLNDPRESWVQQGTDDDLPLLLQTLRDISRQETNSDSDLVLFSAVNSPVLKWYLRDFRQATLGQSLPPDARHEVVLSLVDEQDPLLGADYVGSDFGLLRRGSVPPPPSETPLTDMLRWWLFQETAAGTYEDRLILWVRSDLVLPQQ